MSNMEKIERLIDVVLGSKDSQIVRAGGNLRDCIRREIKNKDYHIERMKALIQKKIGQKEHRAPPAPGKTFEVNPPRSSLEVVLSRLSIGTTTREPTGSTKGAPITTAEFAGMLSGLPHHGDPMFRQLGEILAWAYLGHEGYDRQLADHMDIWGRQHVMFRCPDLKATGREHAKVARAVARRQLYREGLTVPEFRDRSGISERGWPAWRPWVQTLSDRIMSADQALAGHLTMQLRGGHDKMS